MNTATAIKVSGEPTLAVIDAAKALEEADILSGDKTLAEDALDRAILDYMRARNR